MPVPWPPGSAAAPPLASARGARAGSHGLKTLSWLVLFVQNSSGGKTAPKPRNYAAALPLRMSRCLRLRRGAEKTCLFQKDCFSRLWISPALLLPCLTAHTPIATADLCPTRCPWRWLCPLLKSHSALNATAAVCRGRSGGETRAMYVFRHI